MMAKFEPQTRSSIIFGEKRSKWWRNLSLKLELAFFSARKDPKGAFFFGDKRSKWCFLFGEKRSKWWQNLGLELELAFFGEKVTVIWANLLPVQPKKSPLLSPWYLPMETNFRHRMGRYPLPVQSKWLISSIFPAWKLKKMFSISKNLLEFVILSLQMFPQTRWVEFKVKIACKTLSNGWI